MLLPQARNTNLVENELSKELLIYDLLIHKAYSLNETSKIVYQACGKGLTFDELKRQHQLTDDLIYLALDELNENNLIEDGYDSPFAGINRRDVIRRAGLASMIALPVIVGLVAPTAAQAASGVDPTMICASAPTCLTNADCTTTCPTCTGVIADCMLGTFRGSLCNNPGGSCFLFSTNPCFGTSCFIGGSPCTTSADCPTQGTCTVVTQGRCLR